MNKIIRELFSAPAHVVPSEEEEERKLTPSPLSKNNQYPPFSYAEFSAEVSPSIVYSVSPSIGRRKWRKMSIFFDP